MPNYFKDNFYILLDITEYLISNGKYRDAEDYSHMAVDLCDFYGMRKLYKKVDKIHSMIESGEYETARSEIEKLISRFR